MFIFSGDTHGSHDINKLSSKNIKISKEDILFILGDFGLIWRETPNPTEKHWLDWLSNKCRVLVIPGNHENYEVLESFPDIDMYGNSVKVIQDNIYLLKTGEIYTIEDKKVFAFGGAQSVDRHMRVPFFSWWPQEIPSYETMKRGLENLKKCGDKVDFVLTHATHQTMFDKLGFCDNYEFKMKDPLLEYLEEVRKNVEYSYWLNGHYHVDVYSKDTRTFCLYNSVETVESLDKKLRIDIPGVSL